MSAQHRTKLESIVDAVGRAVAEHGAPNSFSPGELSTLYGCALSARMIGRKAIASPNALAWIAAKAGMALTYSERRFHAALVPVVSASPCPRCKSERRTVRHIAHRYESSINGTVPYVCDHAWHDAVQS